MISLKKALLISTFLHIILFIFSSLDIFFRPRIVKWSVSPIELIDVRPKEVKKKIPKIIKKKVIKKEIVKKKENKKEIPLKTKKISNITKSKTPKGTSVVKKRPKNLNEKSNTTPEKLSKKSSLNPEAISSPVSIKVQEFPFNYYLEIIKNKITKNWYPQKGIGEAEIVVFFKILKDGKIRDMSIEDSSDISFLDRSALRAIANSEPFPPLPPAFGKDYLGVHLTFKVKEFEF